MANLTFPSSSEALPIVAVTDSEITNSAMNCAFAFDQHKQTNAVNDDDDDYNSCCICLEPFSPHDPANITSCKHEYHLQCILEWSQRSKECPICLQDFVLMDPTSQELLAAAKKDRHITSRGTSSDVYRNHRHQHLSENLEEASYYEESGFSDHLGRRYAASRGRPMPRDRDLYSGFGQSQGSVFPDSESELSDHLTFLNPSEDGLSEDDSYLSGMQSPILFRSSVSQSPSSVVSAVSANEEGAPKRRFFFGQLASDSPQRPSSSDAVSFSESVKSKFSAASARYKESISKGTRGFKEKFLARNNSVKELSKGVQREMSAGIAGVARMIERLDLKSKQSDRAGSPSGFSGGTSSIHFKGKAVQENLVWLADNNTEEPVYDSKLGTPSCTTNNASGRVDVSYAQRGH